MASTKQRGDDVFNDPTYLGTDSAGRKWFTLPIGDDNSRLIPTQHIQSNPVGTSGQGGDGKALGRDGAHVIGCPAGYGHNGRCTCHLAETFLGSNGSQDWKKLVSMDPIEPKRPEKPKELKVVRELVWRGKRYNVGVCVYCKKESIFLKDVKLLHVEKGTHYLAAVVFQTTPCYRCVQRMADQCEKLAAEMRAACVGGTYTEKELK